MSTNLIPVIMQPLSSEASGIIASSFGLEQSAAERGIAAAIPGLLAGLADSALSPGGAQKLASAVSHMEDMSGADLVKTVVESNHRELSYAGWSTISSLVGGGF